MDHYNYIIMSKLIKTIYKYCALYSKEDSVKELSIAIGKLKEGVDWNSVDGGAVEFVILLGVPSQDAGDTHLPSKRGGVKC